MGPMVDVQTLKFKAIVLVRSFSTPLVRQPKEFVISSSDEIEYVDLARDDVLFNIVTADTALKRNDGDKFWRGPKEKAVSLLQLLISGLSPPGGIICDLTAGTGMNNLFNIPMTPHLNPNQSNATNFFVSIFVGASVLAAQSSNRAIVALEGDKELYEEILQPLQVAASDSQRVDLTHFVDLDDEDDTLPQQGAVNLCE